MPPVATTAEVAADGDLPDTSPSAAAATSRTSPPAAPRRTTRRGSRSRCRWPSSSATALVVAVGTGAREGSRTTGSAASRCGASPGRRGRRRRHVDLLLDHPLPLDHRRDRHHLVVVRRSPIYSIDLQHPTNLQLNAGRMTTTTTPGRPSARRRSSRRIGTPPTNVWPTIIATPAPRRPSRRDRRPTRRGSGAKAAADRGPARRESRCRDPSRCRRRRSPWSGCRGPAR